MSKKIWVIVILFLVIVFGGFCIYQKHAQKKFDSQSLLGGDKDAHGCVGSAGYQWCEIKQKCLRSWEEECSISSEDEVKTVLANKYKKSISDVTLKAVKKTDNHMSGSVNFSPGGVGEGGMFLAVKINNQWQVVFDGNGSVDCEKLAQYAFPQDMLKGFCY